MTDPAGLLRQAIERSELRRNQQEEQLLFPRKIAASILRKRLEEAVGASGGRPDDPAIQKWIDQFLNMYLTLASPLDHFPDWRDELLPHEEASDFFSNWLNEAAKALNAISRGLGK